MISESLAGRMRLQTRPRRLTPHPVAGKHAVKAGMDIYNRTRDVFHRFHLPYDSDPPGE